MGRPKRKSAVLDKAKKRIAEISTISPNLDLGNGLTLAVLNEKADKLGNKIDEHNILISTVDTSGIEVDDIEKDLNDFTERMLAGIGAHYGKDSTEYERAGGVRKSDRKRPVRKAKPDPAGAKG